ncbi:unnamed protein product [Prorocentrum cordatum]|uniref:Uncharacterized protein n=1 Tax=Prorocentrum cordatum TaxID=2364126 RepID=A0ABN9VZ52_9DINO|nr:unnamed protein product [Polarella glacialis]
MWSQQPPDPRQQLAEVLAGLRAAHTELGDTREEQPKRELERSLEAAAGASHTAGVTRRLAAGLDKLAEAQRAAGGLLAEAFADYALSKDLDEDLRGVAELFVAWREVGEAQVSLAGQLGGLCRSLREQAAHCESEAALRGREARRLLDELADVRAPQGGGLLRWMFGRSLTLEEEEAERGRRETQTVAISTCLEQIAENMDAIREHCRPRGNQGCSACSLFFSIAEKMDENMGAIQVTLLLSMRWHQQVILDLFCIMGIHIQEASAHTVLELRQFGPRPFAPNAVIVVPIGASVCSEALVGSFWLKRSHGRASLLSLRDRGMALPRGALAAPVDLAALVAAAVRGAVDVGAPRRAVAAVARSAASAAAFAARPIPREPAAAGGGVRPDVPADAAPRASSEALRERRRRRRQRRAGQRALERGEAAAMADAVVADGPPPAAVPATAGGPNTDNDGGDDVEFDDAWADEAAPRRRRPRRRRALPEAAAPGEAAAAAAGAGLGPPAEEAAASPGLPLVALGAAAGALEAVRAALPVCELAALDSSFEACQGVRAAADDALLRARPPPSEAMRAEVQRMLDLVLPRPAPPYPSAAGLGLAAAALALGGLAGLAGGGGPRPRGFCELLGVGLQPVPSVRAQCSDLARAAAPSCGACAPRHTCPAIPACVCAGAGGQVFEPFCGGLLLAYAAAALVTGSVCGLLGASHYVITSDGDRYDETAVPDVDVAGTTMLSGQGERPPGLWVYGFRALPTAADVWAGIAEASALYGLPRPPSPASMPVAIGNAAGSPSAWRTKWMTEWRMLEDDPVTWERALLRRILELAACYDQVNVGELARLEMTARRLQLLEEKVVELAFHPKGNDNNDKDTCHVPDDGAGNHQFLNAQESEATTWIADELKSEAAVAKGRRKGFTGLELLSLAMAFDHSGRQRNIFPPLGLQSTESGLVKGEKVAPEAHGNLARFGWFLSAEQRKTLQDIRKKVHRPARKATDAPADDPARKASKRDARTMAVAMFA